MVNCCPAAYIKCLNRAIEQTQCLFDDETEVLKIEDQIHDVKSSLYVAIERAEMETERLLTAQELLRELLAFVLLRGDPFKGDKEEVLRIVQKLRTHCKNIK